MSRPIDDALDAALAAIDSGSPAAEVLAGWPDPAEREALAPLIAGAAALGDLPPMDAGRRTALGAELARFEHALYPPPTGGLLAGIPRAPLLVTAVIGASILAWIALGNRPAPPVHEAAPRSNALTPLEAGSTHSAPGGDQGTPASDAPGIATPPGGAAGSNRAPNSHLTPADRAGSPDTSDNIAGTDAPAAAPAPAKLGASATSDVAGSRASATADAASQPLPEVAGFVEVTGKVADPDSRGIPGAVVSAYPLGAAGFYVQRTEADGTYRLRLRPGTYVLRAEAEGFAARWYGGGARRGDAAAVDVTPARPATGIDFTLEPTHNTSHDPGTSHHPAEPPASAAGGIALGGQ